MAPMACRRALGYLLFGLVSGCCLLPPNEDPRVVQKCTSISNVVGKNYKLGARVSSFLLGGGLDFERSGVTLTAEAAERQIELDRLCRTWAVGGMSDDKWADASTKYIVASAVALSRAGNPEAQQALSDNLEELGELLKSLAALKPGGSLDVRSVDDLRQAVMDAQRQSDREISAKLNTLSEAFGTRMDTGNASLREEYRLGRIKYETQQSQVLGALSDMRKRLDELEFVSSKEKQKGTTDGGGVQTSALTWQQGQVFRVTFALGQAQLSDRAKFTLRSNLLGLSKDSNYRVELHGYTDISGSPAANASLSLARAQEARDFLTDVLQLDPSRLFAFGRQRGVTKFGANEENRAVEVRVFVLRRDVDIDISTKSLSAR